MWNGSVVEGTEIESYGSLAEITRGADAVVRGQVIAVVRGRVAGVPSVDELHYAEATVRIEEVLAGSISPGSEKVLLEIPLFAGHEYVEVMQAGVPWDESIYFLRNKGESARRAGLGTDIQEAESEYYRLVVMTGFIVNEAGRAAIAAEARALDTVRGVPFRDVVAMVRNSR